LVSLCSGAAVVMHTRVKLTRAARHSAFTIGSETELYGTFVEGLALSLAFKYLVFSPLKITALVRHVDAIDLKYG
jgi:hypothetical protein